MFASELDNAERMFHVSQGRPPCGYYCTVERRGDRHSPRAGDRHSPRAEDRHSPRAEDRHSGGYLRDYKRVRRAEQREAREAAAHSH